MDNDLIISTLKRVKPDQGKAQWVEGKITGIAKDEAVRTHTVGIPHLMPATIIFVHGVNSEGEWYRDAAAQFSKGLNERLAREDLKPLALEEHDKHRFRRINEKSERVRSPIIPFYWGYSANRRSPDGKYLDKRCMRGRDNTWQDNYGNSLRQDGTWGGGPFQNGTTNLLSFWQSGYRRHILNGIIDTALLNPIIGRELQDCPDRQYYVHAARRLANLVMTIRQDFPNEHINIVAHSQGTMIALCALFYMDAQAPAANGTKLRGPDTVLLNNSPYRFDTRITDYLMAAQGVHDVQTEAARLQTFVNAARIVQNAVEGFPHAPAPDAECTHQPAARQAYDGCAYIHQPPSNPDWQPEIGAQDITYKGQTAPWWKLPLHSRVNRGKLFVNFNPGDRVIGIGAIGGIGWRGIPTRYLDASKNLLGPNVMQRLFARGSNLPHNRPVGSETAYKQAYFFTQIEAVAMQSDTPGVEWTSGDGSPLTTQDTAWVYMDGKTRNTMWKIAPERVLGLVPALESANMRGEGGEIDQAYVNAPLVPVPAELDIENFDLDGLRFDGEADKKLGVLENQEQRADFKEDAEYQLPQRITEEDNNGLKTTRYETLEQVTKRRSNKVGYKVVSPTNHAQILRYVDPDRNVSTVRQVLSYDLTVGPGYAFGDAAYWNYLLDLADWKLSDPYHASGVLKGPGEKLGVENAPPGIARETTAQAMAARTQDAAGRALNNGGGR